MQWPWMSRKPSAELEHARRERQQAEEKLSRDAEKLRHEEGHTIMPLRQIRERNHVQEDIARLVRRRVQREGQA